MPLQSYGEKCNLFYAILNIEGFTYIFNIFISSHSNSSIHHIILLFNSLKENKHMFKCLCHTSWLSFTPFLPVKFVVIVTDLILSFSSGVCVSSLFAIVFRLVSVCKFMCVNFSLSGLVYGYVASFFCTWIYLCY